MEWVCKMLTIYIFDNRNTMLSMVFTKKERTYSSFYHYKDWLIVFIIAVWENFYHSQLRIMDKLLLLFITARIPLTHLPPYNFTAQWVCIVCKKNVYLDVVSYLSSFTWLKWPQIHSFLIINFSKQLKQHHYRAKISELSQTFL